MRRYRSRGLSLFEALVTVALLGLTLSATSGIIRGYQQSFRALDTSSVEIQAQKAVLQGIRSEVMGAVNFTIPSSTSSTWSENLEFSKLDLSVPDRFTSLPIDWTPYNLPGTAPNNNFLVTIRYEENLQTLRRGVRRAGQGSFLYSRVPPSELVSLESRLNNDQTVELRITIPTTREERRVSSKTQLRVQQ